jgi:DNA-binding YbaB/EbfC family protein
MSGDMQKMMREAQKSLMKVQQDMAAMQQELAQMRIEGSAGGGAVTVTFSGSGDIVAVKIKKEAVDPEDVETLEDLVLAAVKDANAKVQDIVQKRTGSITQGLNLPPGLGF